jgi:hypothetical protein
VVLAALAGCAALAALSLLYPSTPANDPWTWLVWGREVGHLDLDTSAGAAWKPLPVMVTTLVAPLGGAAPDIWLLLARTGSLFALVLAFCLAFRLTRGGNERPAGLATAVAAGILAAVALALLADSTGQDGLANRSWVRYGAFGTSEGLLVALILGGIHRHLDGNRMQALLLGCLASLLRPEVWPFLALYAAFVWFREPGRRPLLLSLVVSVPILWIVPPWLGSGDPFGAGSEAVASVREHGIASGPRMALERARGLLPLPVYLAALVAVVAAARRRERVVLALGGGAAAWILGSVLATLGSYPAVARFLIPPGALICVLGGVGAARIAQFLGGGWRGLAVTGALALAAVPFATGRVRALPESVRGSAKRAAVERDLRRVIERAGGRSRILACGRPAVIGEITHGRGGELVGRPSWVAPSLAWLLEVGVADVGGNPVPGSVLFLATRRQILGRLIPSRGRDMRRGHVEPRTTHRLTAYGRWQVYLLGRERGATPL